MLHITSRLNNSIAQVSPAVACRAPRWRWHGNVQNGAQMAMLEERYPGPRFLEQIAFSSLTETWKDSPLALNETKWQQGKSMESLGNYQANSPPSLRRRLGERWSPQVLRPATGRMVPQQGPFWKTESQESWQWLSGVKRWNQIHIQMTFFVF